MKKWKALTVFGMVCALAAMPVLTFAGPSKEISSGSDKDDGGSSSGGSGGGVSSNGTIALGSGAVGPSQSPTTVTVDANGVQTTVAGTMVDPVTGMIIAVPSNGTNAAGEAVTSDANGNTVISNPTTGSSVTVAVGKNSDGSSSTAG